MGTKDDYGYNEAHAAGAAAVKAMPGVKVIEVESTKETKDCENAMESMVNLQGASMIFAELRLVTSRMCRKWLRNIRNVTFLHAERSMEGRHADQCRHLFRLHRRVGIPVQEWSRA